MKELKQFVELSITVKAGGAIGLCCERKFDNLAIPSR
jgi:hypothetical protein